MFKFKFHAACANLKAASGKYTDILARSPLAVMLSWQHSYISKTTTYEPTKLGLTWWTLTVRCASAANNRRRWHYVFRPSVRLSVRLSVCPSVVRPISCDAISPYLVEVLHLKLQQIFIIWVGIAETVFKVIGQRSYVYKRVNAIKWRRRNTFRGSLVSYCIMSH